MSFPGDGDEDQGRPSPKDDLKRRLRDLERRLDAEGGKPQGLSEKELQRRNSALGKALRLSTELLAGIFGGAVIGWLLDSWLGTRPLFLVLFLILGMAAGILNAVRGAREMNRE